MKKIVFRKHRFVAVAFLSLITSPFTHIFAGGIITNTNQSVLFLKDPARDAAIGLDGVYSNPAGVAFMPEGFHVAFNWQYAHQTRTITSTNPVFVLGKKNGGQSVKEFEGVADAPIIPSLQGAYNIGNWSIQFNLSVPGGGGSCEFADGLGSFESVVGSIAHMLQPLGAQGYDMDGYMKGRQYYYGVQVGAAYKIYPNLSVYGGLRMLYGDATYKAKISNIQVKTANGYMDFGSYLQQIAPQARAAGAGDKIAALEKYSQGVNLLCNQAGVGFAPIVGIDYKVGQFNFAAKYEFRTQIRMKNESSLNEASEIPAVNKFRDGEKVNEDVPAMATLGVQYTPIEQVRLSVGGHYFFDKDASWYGNSQENLSHNTYEILWGAEWDTTENLTFSAGAQLTRYGNTDEFINDMSYVVNSYSIGFGFSYKLSQKVAVKAAYFQTFYGNYDKVTQADPTTGATIIGDSFTRTNRVFGVGCQLHL
jgi:long-chain fatty acid transport protein